MTGSAPRSLLAVAAHKLKRHAMTQLRPLIAGNWKMNGLKASDAEFDTISKYLATAFPPK